MQKFDLHGGKSAGDLICPVGQNQSTCPGPISVKLRAISPRRPVAKC